jgi:hypothetical protein
VSQPFTGLVNILALVRILQDYNNNNNNNNNNNKN